MARNIEKSAYVCAYVEPALRVSIEQIAADKGVTVSDVIRTMLWDGCAADAAQTVAQREPRAQATA